MKVLQNYIDSIVNKVLNESLEKKADEIVEKIKTNIQEIDEEEVCEQCGGSMNEGECSECGYNMENINETDSDFDHSDKLKRVCDKGGEHYNEQSCNSHKKYYDEISEELSNKQKKHLDKNKNNRIDKEDFKILRNKKETKEGKKFPDLSGDGKVTRKDILLGRGVKLNGKKSVKESLRLTEDEMIEMIEKIVNEEKDNIRKQSNHPGISTTKKSLDKSKDGNDDYIKSVTKKIKKYLEKTSNGDFEFNPKTFPKGNGELGEMKKKTYKPTKDVEEYIENFSSIGQENLMFDEIHPNEEWMNDNVEGSSRTGNNPKWANAVETDVNKRKNKARKDNLIGVLKKKEGYNRQPQPVYDYNGEDEKERKVSKIFQALESTEDKKTKILNEEIDKMNHLLDYNKKTQ